MSATKMAAQFLSCEERDGITRIKGILDKKLEDIILGYREENHSDFCKEVTASFTKNALLETRRKLFDVAIAVEDERKTKGPVARDAVRKVSDERPEGEAQCLATRGLVNRRVKPAVSNDIADLVAYVGGTTKKFPMQMVKSLAERKKVGTSIEGEIDDKDASLIEQVDISDLSLESASEICVTPTVQSGRSAIQQRVERFVIEETNPQTDKDTVDCQIPVTIVALKELSTSTEDLIRVRSIAIQTDPVIVRAYDRTGQDSEDSEDGTNTSPVDTDVSKNYPVPTVSSRAESIMMEPLDDMFELDQKCERLDRKICLVEREQKRELSSLKAEQSTLRAEIAEYCSKKGTGKSTKPGSKVITPNISVNRRSNASESDMSALNSRNDTDDDCNDWGDIHSGSMVYTQNTQGVMVVTRETPAHRILKRNPPVARNDRQGACGGSSAESGGAPNTSRGGRIEPGGDNRMGTRGNPRNERVAVEQNENDRKRGAPQTGPTRGSSILRKQDNSKPENVNNDRRQKNVSDNQRITAAEAMSDSDQHSDESGGYDAKRIRMDTSNGTTRQEKNTPSCSRSEHDVSIVHCEPSNSSGECIVDGDANNSYADMAAKEPWKIASYNKSPAKKKKMLPIISGADDSDCKDLLVQGLSCKNYKLHKDLEEAVKVYCEERKVSSLYQRVIVFKNYKKTVGCRIRVNTSDANKVYARGFWPKGINVREWYDVKPTERERYFVSECESDESPDNTA